MVRDSFRKFANLFKEVVSLTGNQISYVRFLEDQRHNYATEAVQQAQINELRRHNSVTESQGWNQLLETERSNRARESYNYAALSETSRHNRASESLGWYQAQALAAHYQRSDSIAAQNANTNWYNTYYGLQLSEDRLQHDYAQLRHDAKMDYERLRQNMYHNETERLGTWLRFGSDVGGRVIPSLANLVGFAF
jgi:hypothetical protein